MRRRSFLLGSAALALAPPPVAALSRTTVSLPRTWHVNNVTGSDANDGSSPTCAFQHIQFAVDIIAAQFDIAAPCTIKLATTGVYYNEAVDLPTYVRSGDGGNRLTIQGDPSNNGAVVVYPSSGVPFTGVNCNLIVIDSLCVGSHDSFGIVSDAGAHVLLHNINFSFCPIAHMMVEHAGFLEMLSGNYTVCSGAMWHVSVAARGHFVHQGNYIDFVGNPGFSKSFALGSLGGFLDCRLLLGWSGSYASAKIHDIDNDSTALLVPPNVGYWP